MLTDAIPGDRRAAGCFFSMEIDANGLEWARIDTKISHFQRDTLSSHTYTAPTTKTAGQRTTQINTPEENITLRENPV